MVKIPTGIGVYTQPELEWRQNDWILDQTPRYKSRNGRCPVTGDYTLQEIADHWGAPRNGWQGS